MRSTAKIIAQLRQLDWARGLRSGLAVAVAMVVCRALHLPAGWSALGAFEGNIVDNGGPYRSRFASIALLMGGGSLGALLASLASPHLAWPSRSRLRLLSSLPTCAPPGHRLPIPASSSWWSTLSASTILPCHSPPRCSRPNSFLGGARVLRFSL